MDVLFISKHGSMYRYFQYLKKNLNLRSAVCDFTPKFYFKLQAPPLSVGEINTGTEFHLQRKKAIAGNTLVGMIASVSVGVYQGTPVLDLDYAEDSNAETDMNVVMNADGGFIEVQGTAEAAPFSAEELNEMLDLAKRGIADLVRVQNMALAQ